MVAKKYLTGICINFVSGGVLGLHPRSVKAIDEEAPEVVEFAEKCHIYLIVKRPRISFVPGSLDVNDSRTIGKFKYVKQGVQRESSFLISGKSSADKIEIDGYPHSTLILKKISPNGESAFRLPAYVFIKHCCKIEDDDLKNLEVVYVGKSYADGRRSAKDRLQSHSTLQQVLADLMHDEPDMDVLLLMAHFSPPRAMVSFDGRNKELSIEADRDAMGDLEKAEELLTEDMQISLIEAGLIRYFAPKYNDKYKERFPHSSHKILKELYQLDFDALGVELNSECINARLTSGVVQPGYHHMAMFDLHDPLVRQSFFSLMGVDVSQNANAMSGPAF